MRSGRVRRLSMNASQPGTDDAPADVGGAGGAEVWARASIGIAATATAANPNVRSFRFGIGFPLPFARFRGA